jgi:hypothetical protein
LFYEVKVAGAVDWDRLHDPQVSKARPGPPTMG